MKLRKTVSLTALVSFVLLLMTSVILYIVPQGRVAYWSDWRLWGLSKSQWGDQHLNLGMLFLIAIGLHIWLNWKPIVSYVKNRARQIKLFTRDFNLALAVSALFVIGTLGQWPPFAWVPAWSSAIRDAGAVRYGEPPYGHAELSSVKTLAKKTGLDANEALARLGRAGIAIDPPDQPLLAIARQHRMSPQQVFALMQPRQGSSTDPAPWPDSPPAGFGRQRLADICLTYGLDVKAVRQALTAQQTEAELDKSVKQIAAANGIQPAQLFGMLKAIAQSGKAGV